MAKTLRANIKELLKVTFPTGAFKYSATQPMMSRVADIQSICPFEGWFKLISTEIYTTRKSVQIPAPNICMENPAQNVVATYLSH